MPTFKLPRGYSLTDPELRAVDTVPDKGYGGADISQEFDATGVHYVACNAWGPGDPPFRWRAFRRQGARYVEVPLPFVATGRGEQSVQFYDGKDWGIAWTNETFQFDVIPGFVPFPSIPALEQRIKALESRVATLDARMAAMGQPASDNTLILPPQGEEGGQIAWAPGTGGNLWWFADTVGDVLRVFNSAGSIIAEFKSDGLWVRGVKVG
mgnify:CR=1 FL=1